jgi:DNA primase
MLEKFLAVLGGKRKSETQVVCKCPAHPDKSPSLSVTLTTDGKILFYCFAGCSQSSVMNALKNLGLFESQNKTINSYLKR